MYNRYIPQPDGSYRRQHRPDSPPPPPCQPQLGSPPPRGQGAWDFLKRLLPKDLDTGDLLVIVLILLMAGDGREDRNNALLTLALYLFL